MPSPSVVSEPAAGHVFAESPAGTACRHGSESVIQRVRRLSKEDHRQCLVGESVGDGER
jgi:hypothetical protein